jgi:hypothetical protein
LSTPFAQYLALLFLLSATKCATSSKTLAKTQSLFAASKTGSYIFKK